jgi:hypothetical protein
MNGNLEHLANDKFLVDTSVFFFLRWFTTNDSFLFGDLQVFLVCIVGSLDSVGKKSNNRERSFEFVRIFNGNAMLDKNASEKSPFWSETGPVIV